MQIDVANCQAYSHLCVVITVTSSGDDASNNDGCLEFGSDATKAGDKKCPDVAAKPSSFVITKPKPSEIIYNTSADSAITFDIEASAADGQGTVTGVKLYFTNKDDYDTADTKSSAFDVGGVTSTNVAAGATEKITGATASLKLDAANCAKYTNLCAVLQISTTDTISNNNDVCNKFGTTTADAGSKVCPEETPDTTTPKDSATTVAGQSILMLLLCMIAVTMDF
ncbi:uncharacterized protein [Ptychodera flava]|uniref:uncharacterized protein n=1 Tax=Ptychodera flava TaxID=63121 RepID=UPI00396AA44B